MMVSALSPLTTGCPRANPPFYPAMTDGTLLTLWTARIAFLLYATAVAGWMVGRPRGARVLWTAGFLIYLGHVASAFQFHHHWSHDAAYAETARQTAELLGARSGTGLYWNYAFTAVWAFDVIWIWWSPETYCKRRRWISAAIHSFMAFLFFNATVIFGSGPARWLGLAATVSVVILWLWKRRVAGSRSS